MLIKDFENTPNIAKHIKYCEHTIYYYKANMKFYDQSRPINMSRKNSVKEMSEKNIEIYSFILKFKEANFARDIPR